LILYNLNLFIMVTVFNIEPYEIPVKNVDRRYDFDFLDIIPLRYNVNVMVYYSLLNSHEEFKLKNIYNYIFLRLIKINKKYKKINTIPKINNTINSEYFNNIISEYINSDILKAIIIINSIQLYYLPKLRY